MLYTTGASALDMIDQYLLLGLWSKPEIRDSTRTNELIVITAILLLAD
jgi:hypothetical protein